MQKYYRLYDVDIVEVVPCALAKRALQWFWSVSRDATLLSNFHVYRYIVFTFNDSKYTHCIPIYMEVFRQCRSLR